MKNEKKSEEASGMPLNTSGTKRSIKNIMKDSSFVFAILVTIYTMLIVLLSIASAYPIPVPGTEIFSGDIIMTSLALPLAGLIFILSNIIVEIYGKKKSMLTLFFAYLIGVSATIIISLSKIAAMQSGGLNDYETGLPTLAWADIFVEFRFMIVGIVAFTVSMGANAAIIWSMKKRFGDKLLSLRLLISSLIGQMVDNLTFVTLAYAPIGWTINENWMTLHTAYASAFFEYSIEIGIEVALIPISHMIIYRIKRVGLYESLSGEIIKYDHIDSLSQVWQKKLNWIKQVGRK